MCKLTQNLIVFTLRDTICSKHVKNSISPFVMFNNFTKTLMCAAEHTRDGNPFNHPQNSCSLGNIHIWIEFRATLCRYSLCLSYSAMRHGRHTNTHISYRMCNSRDHRPPCDKAFCIKGCLLYSSPNRTKQVKGVSICVCRYCPQNRYPERVENAR